MVKLKLLAAVCGAVLVLGACGDTAGRDDEIGQSLKELGKIHVITRESGSGTRSSLAQMLDLKDEGADDRDHFREDAQMADSGENEVKLVEEDPSAVGFVTFGMDLSDSRKVRTVSVDNVSPDQKTIEDGSYPLTRTLYLAGMNDENELEKDFLSFVTGKGQDTVAQYFVPAGESKDIFLSSQPSGTLKIAGSTSLAPAVEKLAEEYESMNPNAAVEVSASDSSSGISETLTGGCDLAMVSRELYDYEKDFLHAVPVAKDAVCIIVPNEQPLKNMTLSDLTGIFSGKIEEWSEIDND